MDEKGRNVPTEKRAAASRAVFETMPVPRALATLAVPTIIGQLTVLIYNLADTFFIGRTRNPYMVAAASLILPFFNFCVPLSNLFAIGGGTLISRLLGARKDGEARKISAFSLMAAGLFAAAFAVLTAIFMDPLLTLLGASPKTMAYARQYAGCVIVAGAVPAILQMTMAGLLRSVGCTRQAGIGVTFGGVLNIGLDPLFMFVLLPKGMEVTGAGLATMLSNTAACVYFILVIRSRGSDTVLALLPRGLPARGRITEIFAVGIPAAVATLLFDVDYIIIDKLMTGYGDIPLAAVGIVLKAERLPLNIGVGLCQGMVPIAAYNYSSRNYGRMKHVLSFTRLSGLAVGALSILLYETLAPGIMRVFISDAETVAIGTDFLRIRALATPFMFMCFHLTYFFQAVGNGRIALELAAVRWAAFNIPMLFLLNAFVGMYGLVWTQLIADLLTVIVSLLVYQRFVRKELS